MAKQFWHNTITDKSWQALQDLRSKLDFILIGGWAVYLYTKKMKSKDIDIIVNYEELGKLKDLYEVHKNERLKKYEINLGEFDIDIYLPHYSRLGFPLEKISNYTQKLEGFIAPKVEILLLLKLFAYQDRKDSTKGEKDRLDIISLFDRVDINWGLVNKITRQHQGLDYQNLIKDVVSVDRASELNLNNQAMSKLRNKILENLEKIKFNN